MTLPQHRSPGVCDEGDEQQDHDEPAPVQYGPYVHGPGTGSCLKGLCPAYAAGTGVRAYALALVALMVSAPLAGCAGSDGDVTVDLSPDEIQELMDANLASP